MIKIIPLRCNEENTQAATQDSPKEKTDKTPVSVPMDQFACFPLPLIPAKGFSWKRTCGQRGQKHFFRDLFRCLLCLFSVAMMLFLVNVLVLCWGFDPVSKKPNKPQSKPRTKKTSFHKKAFQVNNHPKTWKS